MNALIAYLLSVAFWKLFAAVVLGGAVLVLLVVKLFTKKQLRISWMMMGLAAAAMLDGCVSDDLRHLHDCYYPNSAYRQPSWSDADYEREKEKDRQFCQNTGL